MTACFCMNDSHSLSYPVAERWPDGNTYTNSWKAPTYMVSVDDTRLRGSGSHLKRKLWNAAQDILEEWTDEDLEPTSMYGIRVYTDGAILLPHVDRLPLVSSAMVCVAKDVDEDWPMEICKWFLVSSLPDRGGFFGSFPRGCRMTLLDKYASKLYKTWVLRTTDHEPDSMTLIFESEVSKTTEKCVEVFHQRNRILAPRASSV